MSLFYFPLNEFCKVASENFQIEEERCGLVVFLDSDATHKDCGWINPSLLPLMGNNSKLHASPMVRSINFIRKLAHYAYFSSLLLILCYLGQAIWGKEFNNKKRYVFFLS